MHNVETIFHLPLLEAASSIFSETRVMPVNLHFAVSYASPRFQKRFPCTCIAFISCTRTYMYIATTKQKIILKNARRIDIVLLDNSSVVQYENYLFIFYVIIGITLLMVPWRQPLTTSTRHLVLGSGRPIVQQRHSFSKEVSMNKTASQTNFLLQGWGPC